MKLIDANGKHIVFKEQEKLIPEVRVEEKEAQTYDEVKDNMCMIDDFKCYHSDKNPCVYLSDGNGTLLRCKYNNLGWCESAVAQTNAMVMELKKMGFKYVKLEG